MKTYPLGEFEEIVLLTVGVLFDEAYGVAIKDAVEERAHRKDKCRSLAVCLEEDGKERLPGIQDWGSQRTKGRQT